MHHRIDFMLALIDPSIIFIVAGCLLYFQNETGAFPCSGAAMPRLRTRWERRLQAATLGWRQELPLLWTTSCCSWPLGWAAIKVWEWKLGLKCANYCIWCCRMGQLASNGKRHCNLLRGNSAPNSTMTRSALRRHKNDAEEDDDEWRRRRRRPRCGLLGFYAGMGLELTCDAQLLPSPYCCVNVLRWPGLLRRRCGLAAIENETATKKAP